MKYVKKMTVKEWKRFEKFTDDIVNGQSLTMQEILLDRYKIILTDHVNKRKVGPWCTVTLKEKLKTGLKSIPGKITQENFDKGLKTFDKGMADFNKSMDELSRGLGGNGPKPKLYSQKKTNNIEILMGKKKPVQKRRGRKPKSENWDKHERNLEKLWGKKK